jgi:hypothetical protein
MPSSTVAPSSDITTTDWSTTGSNFNGVLSASSGAGDGTHYVDQSAGTGGTNNLVLGCTFNTTGIVSITGVTYTVHWETSGKGGTSDFQLILKSNGGATTLASMATFITTSSTSEVASGPTAMTLNNSTPSNWTNFQMVVETCFSGSPSGNFFGLNVSITYTTSSGVTSVMSTVFDHMSGGMQTLGMNF